MDFSTKRHTFPQVGNVWLPQMESDYKWGMCDGVTHKLDHRSSCCPLGEGGGCLIQLNSLESEHSFFNPSNAKPFGASLAEVTINEPVCTNPWLFIHYFTFMRKTGAKLRGLERSQFLSLPPPLTTESLCWHHFEIKLLSGGWRVSNCDLFSPGKVKANAQRDRVQKKEVRVMGELLKRQDRLISPLGNPTNMLLRHTRPYADFINQRTRQKINGVL
jgi:hypothetical protein